MAADSYMKQPYLSRKYRKAKLHHPTNKVLRLLFADKDINVPEAIRKFKATKDPFQEI